MALRFVYREKPMRKLIAKDDNMNKMILNDQKNTKNSLAGHYKPNLLKLYFEDIQSILMKKFGYKNLMEIPKLLSITLNMGIGDARENAKALKSSIQNDKIIEFNPEIIFKRVVLPHPDGPMIETNSVTSMSKFKSSKANSAPYEKQTSLKDNPTGNGMICDLFNLFSKQYSHNHKILKSPVLKKELYRV